MARPPIFKAQEKQRGSCSRCCAASAAWPEAARRNKCSETSITKGRDLFMQGGLAALGDGAQRGPTGREAQLERELAEVTTALGEAHVQLRLVGTRRYGGVRFQELEMIRQDAGLAR